jgi:hypothetical protein
VTCDEVCEKIEKKTRRRHLLARDNITTVLPAVFSVSVFCRVLDHGVTSSFFGIGILPVSDLLGSRYFWSVLLIWRELLFSAKGGLAVSKRGPVPPFYQKGGQCPLFELKRGSRQKNDTQMYQPRFPLVSVW